MYRKLHPIHNFRIFNFISVLIEVNTSVPVWICGFTLVRSILSI